MPPVFLIKINSKAITLRFKTNSEEDPTRPIHILTPKRNKPCLSRASSSIDFEVIPTSREGGLIVTDGEQIVVLVVRELQDDAAVIDRVSDYFDPPVSHRLSVSNENGLKTETISLKSA